MMNNNTVTVDVREDLRSGREPFSKILNAVVALHADEQLLLIAPFEPVPLFRVMEKQGFAHRGQATAAGDWEILFTREPNPRSEEPAAILTVAPTGRGGDGPSPVCRGLMDV